MRKHSDMNELVNKVVQEQREAERVRAEAVRTAEEVERQAEDIKSQFDEKDRLIAMYRDAQVKERTERKMVEN